MQVSVRVQPDVAPAFQGTDAPPAEVNDLRLELEALGVGLEPMHPGIDDPELATYFTVEVPDDDEEIAAQVLVVLSESALVDAAYVKPPDELP